MYEIGIIYPNKNMLLKKLIQFLIRMLKFTNL